MTLSERFKRLLGTFGTVKMYKRKSVFYRFWILIALGFAAALVILIVFVGNYSSTSYHNNMARMFSKNMYNMRNSLDSIFSEIISEMKEISVNRDIMEMKDSEVFNVDITDETEVFLRKVLSQTDFIKSVYLYYPESDYVLSSSVLYHSGARSEFEDMSWYDTYYKSNSEIFLREYPENSVFQKCISVCKKINGDDNLLAIFNINYDKLNIIRKQNVLMDYEISMINDAGMIIYSTSNEKIGQDVTQYKEMSEAYFMAANNYTVNSNITKSFLHESIRTKCINLSIVAEILKQNIYDIRGIDKQKVILAAAFLLGILALSVILSTKIYGFVMRLYEQMPSDNSEKRRKTDELSDISNQISDIVNKKSETESELAESLMQLQKAQSIALQSQFSPHFLFNTLQMINSIALVELDGDSDITTAVRLLCNILHVAIDTTEYTCKFDNEIKLAKEYITLQNMKYEGVFNVTFDIDEETLDVLVVKLFLQPILENSMHHGYSPTRNAMNIKISAHIENGNLVVTVEDDGIGMTKEREREIADSLENKQLEKKNSIGLLNLNQRVKLIFGYEYGCKVANSGNGVTVTVIFPSR